MKKLLMILAFVAITSTGAYAYSGYVQSPAYGYGTQNSVTYYDGLSSASTLYYSLYVQSYGEAQITAGPGKNWRNGTPNSYQNGYFTGPFSYVTLTCYVTGSGGFAYASATW